MYRKLLPLAKRFVFVRQGAFNRYYEGKLVDVDGDTIQIQSYKKDGSPEELWTISLETITEFSVGGRHLAELELKVSFLSSGEVEDENEPEVRLLNGLNPVISESSADEIAE